jgi:hypothetical protein
MFEYTPERSEALALQENQMADLAATQKTELHLYDIVDELLEKELLGLLLSTSHFQHYCKIMAKTASEGLSEAFSILGMNQDVATKFQHSAMQQFSGLYIAECKISSKRELAARLDEKLKQFFEADFTPEAQIKMSKDIENAWKYRLATQGIRF